MSWWDSEERKRLQLQQASAAWGAMRVVFVGLAVPAVVLVFAGERMQGWLRVAAFAVAAALGAVLAAAIVVLGREHAREVKRIDDEGLMREARELTGRQR